MILTGNRGVTMAFFGLHTPFRNPEYVFDTQKFVDAKGFKILEFATLKWNLMALNFIVSVLRIGGGGRWGLHNPRI